MAKSISKRTGTGNRTRRIALWVAALAVIGAGAAIWLNRTTIGGVGDAGTSYAARVACSCRFVAGRTLESCETDLMAGMEMVSLSDDIDAKSVTATLPLVTSTTATYREGYGCMLETWEG